jgi:hypothetical protein
MNSDTSESVKIDNAQREKIGCIGQEQEAIERRNQESKVIKLWDYVELLSWGALGPLGWLACFPCLGGQADHSRESFGP